MAELPHTRLCSAARAAARPECSEFLPSPQRYSRAVPVLRYRPPITLAQIKSDTKQQPLHSAWKFPLISELVDTLLFGRKLNASPRRGLHQLLSRSSERGSRSGNEKPEHRASVENSNTN